MPINGISHILMDTVTEMIRHFDFLVSRAVSLGHIDKADREYVLNGLRGCFHPFDATVIEEEFSDYNEALKNLSCHAGAMGLFDAESTTLRDNFETRLMGILTPKPSEVIRKFMSLYDEDKKKATDYFYDLSRDTNYIRVKAISKNKKWNYKSRYGDIGITINLSKPEKDPKAIIAAGKAKSEKYPKCLLCRENEGYFGRMDHPARQNLRLIPFELDGRDWFLQYSPYSYFNEHSIVLSKEHVPMSIGVHTFRGLLAFLDALPHYFIGSNADLPIVGGSILSHNHYQSGRFDFPIQDAKVIGSYEIDTCAVEMLSWPLTTMRIRSKDASRVISLAEKTLSAWISYSDESAGVLAYTDERHNTITPIARMKGDEYELDLVLRNNRTTEERPYGIFHPREEYHHIKKENIGLIEVMGLAVLPARLLSELREIAVILSGGSSDMNLSLHHEWMSRLMNEYEKLTYDEAMEILMQDTGRIFTAVLEDAGVFKMNDEGINAFSRFVESLRV